jgi:hypothetical protein
MLNQQGLGTFLTNQDVLETPKQKLSGSPPRNSRQSPASSPAAGNDARPAINGQAYPLPAKLKPRSDVALRTASRPFVGVSRAADPEPNTDLAMVFLNELDPHSDARWDLVAINPEPPKGALGKIECATFLRQDLEKMRRWIDQRQGKKNLYTSVHRARPEVPHNVRLNHKTGKQIGKLRAIPGDIDVKKIKDPSGQNFRAKRDELLREVAPILAKLGCRPSLLVDSGGGLQPWFFLELPIEATPENVELVEGIGRALKERYAGELDDGFQVDNVGDAARIMRLPGTINLPDKNKKAEGRSPALATVRTDYSSGKTYTLDQLKAWAPPIPEKQSAGSKDKKLPKIDMDLVHSANSYEELSDELRKKFESLFAEDPALEKLWKNGEPVPGQTDSSGSGFSFALARSLKRYGDRFTPTEFGLLLWVWPHSYDPKKITARTIGKDWDDADPATWSLNTASGFSDASGTTSAEEWDEPTNLWAKTNETIGLPAGVMPSLIENTSREWGRRLGVEPGAPAAALLTALGSLISARNTLQLRQHDPDWTVKPILWTMLVGEPGSNKSAVLGYAIRPVEDVQAQWQKEHAQALHVSTAAANLLRQRNVKPQPPSQRSRCKLPLPTTLGSRRPRNPSGETRSVTTRQPRRSRTFCRATPQARSIMPTNLPPCSEAWMLIARKARRIGLFGSWQRKEDRTGSIANRAIR